MNDVGIFLVCSSFSSPIDGFVASQAHAECNCSGCSALNMVVRDIFSVYSMSSLNMFYTPQWATGRSGIELHWYRRIFVPDFS